MHSRISIPVVLDFLDFYCTDFERQYRTLSVYKCALKLPLLWTCDVDIEGLDITAYFMRGVFNFNPPEKAREMPRWSLNHLLRYLSGTQFEPLQLATPMRLIQKNANTHSSVLRQKEG